MEVLLEVLKDFGFPVACVAALFWQLSKEQQDHKQETQALTQAVNDLRVVLAKLCTRLGVGDDGK